MWWTTEQKIKSVYDMYKYAKENDVALLSEFVSSQTVLFNFWQEYINDHEAYDRAFCTMFKDFFYFDQDGTESVEDIFNRFVQAVEDYLMLNDKKYTSMYYVELMSVNADSILTDYKIVEEKENENSTEREYESGARTDDTESTSGQRTDVDTDQVMAYNSTTFVDQAKSTSQKGAQTDSLTFDKGAQTDTENVSESGSHTITTSGSKTNPYENMSKYLEVWDAYSFYTKVFKDIASNLLLA